MENKRTIAELLGVNVFMLSPEINYVGKIKKVKSSTAKKSIFFCHRAR
ncbi:MAG: hypothetical protein KAT56_04650 [Sedimentisphaerales bacterium]|nr:hypothetical protein [Sedimentisphaerales bacterium]